MNVDRAARYNRLKRRAGVSGTLLSTVMLVALIVTGASAWLRDLAAGATAASHGPPTSPAAIAIYVLLLCALWQAVALPLAYYSGVVLERRYGLTLQTTKGWLGDQVKGALVVAALAIAGAVPVIRVGADAPEVRIPLQPADAERRDHVADGVDRPRLGFRAARPCLG